MSNSAYAYRHGYRNAKEGHPIKLNPYLGYDFREKWEKGWRDYHNEAIGIKDFILNAFFWRKR